MIQKKRSNDRFSLTKNEKVNKMKKNKIDKEEDFLNVWKEKG